MTAEEVEAMSVAERTDGRTPPASPSVRLEKPLQTNFFYKRSFASRREEVLSEERMQMTESPSLLVALPLQKAVSIRLSEVSLPSPSNSSLSTTNTRKPE